MQILGISHLAVAADDPETARRFFHEILELPQLGTQFIAEEQATAEVFGTMNDAGASQDTHLELLRCEGENSPLKRFTARSGGKIHHLAFRVADLDAALAELRRRGVRLIDDVPRRGMLATRVAFIHPESTGGVLVELVEN